MLRYEQRTVQVYLNCAKLHLNEVAAPGLVEYLYSYEFCSTERFCINTVRTKTTNLALYFSALLYYCAPPRPGRGGGFPKKKKKKKKKR